jgi:hypothetical protein
MVASPVEDEADKAAAEGRQTPRERTFLPARISYGDAGALSTQATVTQLSRTGARLGLSRSISLPDHFDLVVPSRNLTCHARLIWRKGDQAGVEFEPPEARAEPAMSAQERIKALEAANAKLRVQVAELLVQVQRLTEG